MKIVDNENRINQYWDDHNIFRLSLQKNKEKQKFIFYDGPPFATGLPHYGHILASTIKDIIPRFKSQNGFFVERRWGTDCHGLPIEYEIEKLLNIKTKSQILEFGIKNYNDECRKIVFRCKDDWEKTIKKLGRWVDFKNDYKTLDPEFMESVWNVFSELYNKKLIYKGFKIMPYSTGCTTPLSNFEANSNYKSIMDSSLTTKFILKDTHEIKSFVKNITNIELNNNIYLLVWTTTPWTLPSNLSLCINKKLKYSIIRNKKKFGNKEGSTIEEKILENFIICDDCIDHYFNENEYERICEIPTDKLLYKEYLPLFDFYKNFQKSFKIVEDSFVKSEKGTGFVHLAPIFGEDDMRVCENNKIISRKEKFFPECIINDNGIFKHNVNGIDNLKNTYVKDADKIIIIALKKRNLVFKSCKERHDYPFCWRSDTPLIYKAVSCWFLETTKIKEKIIKNNEKINWSPEWVGKNRFGKWLENMSDWCISRNRYWGTPLPIWESEDKESIIVIDSIAKLEELAELPPNSINDIHRHNIDNIQIKSKDGKIFKRTSEVFDCWFESGSMPYGQNHYPFKIDRKTFLENHFPADFIAEGLDQTRGWFYTLLVLSTALFDREPFKNVIVNGLILAKDGQKMSKRKKNYVPPETILNKFGADSLRLYLINSPVVKAEEMSFKDNEVEYIIKDIHLPIYNILDFIQQMKDLYEKKTNKLFKMDVIEKTNYEIIDKWIIHKLVIFINEIHDEMNHYRLYKIVGKIIKFLKYVSKWYINLNKEKIKVAISNMNQNNKKFMTLVYNKFNLLCWIGHYLSIMIAPFAPFIAEHIFLELKKYKTNCIIKSVHLMEMPRRDFMVKDEIILKNMEIAIRTINLGRKIRSKWNISLKIPIKELVIIQENIYELSGEILEMIRKNLNIINIKKINENKYIDYDYQPNYKKQGKLFGKDLKKFKEKLNQLSFREKLDIQKKKQIIFLDKIVALNDLEMVVKFKNIDEKYKYLQDDDIMLLMDITKNADDDIIYRTKLLLREIQVMRKSAGLKQTDKIKIYYNISEKKNIILKNCLNENQNKYILPHLDTIIYPLNRFLEEKNKNDNCNLKILYSQKLNIVDEEITIYFTEILKM